jgi:5-methyltetrahydropteroyltriglutamate--homocysteine methyltransferase
MKRSSHRILTTHVGSLVRPPDLVELGAAGDTARYEERLRAETAQVVRRQAAAGVDIVSDGEYGKADWSSYVLRRITGFEIRPHQLRPVEWLGRDKERFAEAIAKEMPGALAGRPTEACIGPISYTGQAAIAKVIGNFLDALQGVTVEEAFLTAVAPASTAFDGVNEYYPSERAYIYAIADALREEYRAIHQSGLLLQVDDAVLANMYDHLIQTSPEHYRKWAELRVEALNHALEGIPEDRIRYHVCFGSWHVPHVADAPLEEIVGLILRVRAGAYSIEAANPRHEHEWRVWENGRLPEGKIVIPGVVTHHTTTVEHPRLVADRIVRYARLVGRENVIAGTDCGFAQLETIQRVPAQVMWAKLESLAEGARIASRELWP